MLVSPTTPMVMPPAGCADPPCQATVAEADARPAFARAREWLRARLGQDTFHRWIAPLAWGGVEGQTAVLRLPSRFMAEWVRDHFQEPIRLAIEAAMPGVDDVRIECGAGVPPAPYGPTPPDSAPALEPSEAREPTEARRPAFDPRYSFRGFVVGRSNELAYRAARTLAEAVGTGAPAGFNPLFLHGPTGLGKTHLMHAIGQGVQARLPTARIAYLSAERFMVEFLAALRARDTISFKQRLRSCDLLMIDDVQFIAGKESTQEEFFHTMNEIIGAGRWLVISADRSPQNLEGIESRIQSRLAWGLVADIHPADYELRLNILKAKLGAQPEAAVPADVVEFLARRIVANVRELEGALNRVLAYAQLTGRTVDLDFTREVLADVLKAHARRLTIDDIQRRVADHYRIRVSDLLSPRRARDVARPRQVAMYLAKQLTSRSLPEIGRRFGGRDHTTVMHAIRRIEELRRTDPELDRDLDLLLRALDG
ncbi:MAG: chromosomal replication initiator protein DnaA [Sphingomonadaceae bacterium]|nr:chromosomal replication initiator protein DnaA [Thermaurantiacus sp.]MCS6986899.1 chromosomal replication initiator protein DnaA [Sphingomonadaceae bacterium]MDW8415501.1 chromosomal replication initiator protein DnaA [Thermaurantiacus sp.]